MPGVEKVQTPSGAKYQIHITGGQGIVIGDRPQVTQHIGESSGVDIAPKTTPGEHDDTRAEKLYQTILDGFDLEELRTLCFYLDVEYDDLRGEGRAC